MNIAFFFLKLFVNMLYISMLYYGGTEFIEEVTHHGLTDQAWKSFWIVLLGLAMFLFMNWWTDERKDL